MPTERTGLLATPTTYETANNAAPGSLQTSSLHQESTSLLEWTRKSLSSRPPASTSSRPKPSDPKADIATLLYALSLLSRPAPRGSSIRATLPNSVLGLKVQAYLCDAIEDLLDAGGSSLDDAEGEEEEEGEVQRICWRLWAVGDGSEAEVCVIDLILPPYAQIARTSPFLSHPLLRHVLAYTWSRGIPRAEHEHESTLTSLKHRLEATMTQFRLHLLHLASFLVLIGLTFALAIRPPLWMFPYTPKDELQRFSALEIIWAIWTAASFLETLQQSTPLIRRLLRLPAHLALFFIPLNPTTSYSLLTISIPTLTTLLVLPIPPSVPLLIHPLLPLSSLLLNMLLGSIRSAALLMPLVIALFLLFAWAMNGDIFRGFHLLPSAPEEPRIAPFEARLWIFITAILLLVFSITMTISRAIVPIREGWDEDGARRWRGAIKEGDEWEREYGVTVARLARRRLGLAVQEMVRPVLSPIRNPRTSNGDGVSGGEEARHQREDLDPKVTPHRSAKARAVLVPINVLCLPLDIALLALHLAQVLRVFSLDHRTHYGLFEVRDWIAVMVVGLPCYLFERVGRLTDYESSTAIRS